ncbi:L-dopachrome tautomerase-related protein [Micromonospora radicis]|uniref:Gluconolaconase n=1 Tax=Micromonospora radicis TaxID=1894971 RepID=A0A418MSK0_9ACTN|nr:L-dopachrome tautomerase-related protein [Micromonospora radicis]RIV37072.1 gluconolaconase [Micromonospora radicis]
MSEPVSDEPVGELELVHAFTGSMPTGVSVSHTGRIFVNYPRWGDEVPATVAELRDGREVPFPDERWNQQGSDDDPEAFVSVQSVVVDPADRLWALDTGSPSFQPTSPGGPKLVRIDLATDTVAQVITFPPDVALPTTYLNDVRFDLRRGEAGIAYVTDSAVAGPNGIVVIDLATGASWRRLHDHPSTKAEPLSTFRPLVEGRPFRQHLPDAAPRPVTVGSDGIAISADGARLYYCALASRQWYSVATDALVDLSVGDDEVAATVVHEGDKGSGSDGLESDDAGRIYLTAYEQNAVLRRHPDGGYETVAHDPRLLWPDTMSVAVDGYLYVTANQLHRQAGYHGGKDLRRKPYALFRIRIDAGPVLLR